MKCNPTPVIASRRNERTHLNQRRKPDRRTDSTWGPDQVRVRFQLSRGTLKGSWREVELRMRRQGDKSWRMKLKFDQQRWMGTEKQSTDTHDCDHLFSLCRDFCLHQSSQCRGRLGHQLG